MGEPRYRRRKEDRPDEIAEAAMEAFAENGYAATRVDDVARRAGVSKGLLYLYFKTKEELFKAVIKRFVSPRIEQLGAGFDASDMSAETFLRGPFLETAKSLSGSRIGVLLRLMIAEGPRHPDLVRFYWENVASKGIDTLNRVIQRGIDSGEFKPTVLANVPPMIVMPVLFGVIFKLVFNNATLDTDRLIEDQLEVVLHALKEGVPA